MRPFIPKENQELPDAYGLKIHYLDGRTDEFELAGHNVQIIHGVAMLYLATKDDIWNWVPLTSVKRLEWDQRWSKILALKEKEDRKKNAAKV